jgi:hypothetical protein
MGGLSDAIFGSAGKSRSGATKGDIKRAQEFIEKATAQAREDIFAIAPQAMENRLLGQSSAFDLVQQGIPAQLGAFQGGGMQAQNTKAQGLNPQIQALLGIPMDAVPTPQALPTNIDFLTQAQMPQFNQEITAEQVQLDTPNKRTQMLLDKYAAGKLNEERALKRLTKDGNKYPGVSMDQAVALLGGYA